MPDLLQTNQPDTKNGALLGEAIVINNLHLQKDFDFHLKQRGALLAKGRVLGIQFFTLLQNDLYLKNARHANACAEAIANAAKECGYTFLATPQTNQLFIVLPLKKIRQLEKNYEFYIWKKIDENTAAVRIVTSWATDENMVKTFIKDLQKK